MKEQVTLVKCHQPPPNLPRRGGIVTLASNIIVSSRLIISGLSIAIVTVPPLRGRLGGGWYDCLKKSDYQWLINSNSNCPSPTGEARWGLIPSGLFPFSAIMLAVYDGLSLGMFASWWRTVTSVCRCLVSVSRTCSRKRKPGGVRQAVVSQTYRVYIPVFCLKNINRIIS